jgi:hypothetical protein
VDASSPRGWPRRSATPSPSLSVILLSVGTCADLERAIASLAGPLRELAAQLIVVRRNPEPPVERALAAVARYRIVKAPDDCTRGDMRGLGMRAAQGDIVALRDDVSIVDGEWLACFRPQLLTTREWADAATEHPGHFGPDASQFLMPAAEATGDGGRRIDDGFAASADVVLGDFPQNIAASA